MSEQEQQRMIDTDLRHARTAAHDTARHALPCGECGSTDGLIEWNRATAHVILAIIQDDKCKLPKFYRAPDCDTDCLYTLCPTCRAWSRPGGMDDIEQLSAAELTTWIMEIK